MNTFYRFGLAIALCAAPFGCGSDPAPVTDAGVIDTGLTDAGNPDTGTGNPDTGTGNPDTGTGNPDTGTGVGAGTCDSPINLNTSATREGDAWVYRGTTTGAANNLHPYEGCVPMDTNEVVLRYQVESGVDALMISTQGSGFDTAVYARVACSQAAGGADLGCNNDSYDNAPQSTLYLTNFTPGQVLFIVVDGNAGNDTMAPSTGDFTVTLRPVTRGAMGNPCRAVTDPPTPRCDGALACSEGGAADGTAICVPSVAIGAACDNRRFTNLCVEGTTCVAQPPAMEGDPAMFFCRAAGTAQNAPCRMVEPRCDAPLACGAGESPTCVPVLSMGVECDPTGQGNRCASGLTCSPLGDAGGPAICHS